MECSVFGSWIDGVYVPGPWNAILGNGVMPTVLYREACQVNAVSADRRRRPGRAEATLPPS